jgi:subtilisin family serine protease
VDLVGGGLADDCHGHGTHMAGTVGGSYFGVAKGVSLVAVRVLDCTGQGTVTNVIAGLDWVASHHAPLSIANLSFSTGYHSVLNQAVANTMAAGVTVVVSGGDGGISGYDACSFSPASATGALTAGASRQISGVDYMANISTFGGCIDLFAPGYQITSTWIGVTDGNSWSLDGTSSAAAHSSGAAALYLAANPSSSPADVVSGVIANATTGLLSGLGAGSPTAFSTRDRRLSHRRRRRRQPPICRRLRVSRQAVPRRTAVSTDQRRRTTAASFDTIGASATVALPRARRQKRPTSTRRKGSYSVTVTLTVSDAAGLTASYRKTLNIRNNGK